MRKCLPILLLVVAMAGFAQATPIVLDTTTTATGNDFNRFGATGSGGETETLGETFLAPVGAATFRRISFDIRVDTGPLGPQTADAYFLAWDIGSNRPIGPILGSVTGLVLPGTSTSLYDRVTADFGSIAVTPGQLYVAYFTTLIASPGAYPGVTGYFFKGRITGIPPVPDQFGGQVVFSNSDSLDTLTNGSAGTWLTPLGGPLAFVAEFETPVVPELDPGGAVLPLAWACLGLLAARRRRTANA